MRRVLFCPGAPLIRIALLFLSVRFHCQSLLLHPSFTPCQKSTLANPFNICRCVVGPPADPSRVSHKIPIVNLSFPLPSRLLPVPSVGRPPPLLTVLSVGSLFFFPHVTGKHPCLPVKYTTLSPIGAAVCAPSPLDLSSFVSPPLP